MDDRTESEYERGTGSALSDLTERQRDESEAEREIWYRGGGTEREDVTDA